MARNTSVKLVWDEGGTCHAVRGIEMSNDAQFVVIKLVDGTELSIAKARIVKIERSPGGV